MAERLVHPEDTGSNPVRECGQIGYECTILLWSMLSRSSPLRPGLRNRHLDEQSRDQPALVAVKDGWMPVRWGQVQMLV